MRNKLAYAIRLKKMAQGGAAESSNDGDTLGSIIGYPGSPKPKGMAFGGNTMDAGVSGDSTAGGEDEDTKNKYNASQTPSKLKQGLGDSIASNDVIGAFNRFKFADGGKISKAIRAAKMAAGGEVLKDSDDFLSADMSDEANESANDELETEQYPDDDNVENPQKKRIAGIFSRMK